MQITVTIKSPEGIEIPEIITVPDGWSAFVQTDDEVQGINTSGKIDARPNGYVMAVIARTNMSDEVIEKSPVV